ncbi:MAG TPA: phosphoribosylglycinamide formyltransferase [Rhodospirillaceae bacterium]|nr:phosphoribosylglycinamide formyltransferase [Rhodospirillaceae bacterium]
MTENKLNLAVFISGRGSNLQSLIDACQSADFPARISFVLSNRSDAYGLERARKAGIPTSVVLHRDYPTRETFEDAMMAELAKHPVDLICLAGFMRILTPHFINRWPDKIINIHPSLLPDYKGLHTHERALADGKKEAGCTIHYVVPEMDSGPIIMQKRVPILPGDTPETLAARVLEQEHIAYPEVIRKLANKR